MLLLEKIILLAIFYKLRLQHTHTSTFRYKIIKKDKPLEWLFSVLAVLFVSVVVGQAISYLLTDVWEITNIQQGILNILEIKVRSFDIYSLLLILSLVVMAPVIEEFLFRGLLQGYLQKISPVLGILLTSFIFAMAHWEMDKSQYVNIAILAQAFIFSIITGLVYYQYESLLLASIIHFTCNLANVVEFFF